MKINNPEIGESSSGLLVFLVIFYQILFFILKICGVIEWDWVWVFSPILGLMLPLVTLIVLIFLIGLFVVVLFSILEKIGISGTDPHK